MTDPIVGKAEDFQVEVLTEIGAQIRQSVFNHVAVNDEHLAEDAKTLPQLIFYYQAAWCRLDLRSKQTKLRLEQAEANAYVQQRAAALKLGEKAPVDEIKARVVLDDAVRALALELVEIESKADTVRGILDALRQKGYSLQLVGSIRSKEEDWLRNSFADRFKTHPDRERIALAFNQIMGTNVAR